jgi:hypothetical protein
LRHDRCLLNTDDGEAISAGLDEVRAIDVDGLNSCCKR